jgi:hypothetical protein
VPRDFESASSHRLSSGSTTGWSTFNSPFTLAALCTVESLPTAGSYRCVVGLSSTTTARQLGLMIDGTTGSIALQVGASLVTPGTAMVPTLDTWSLIAVTKGTGTVAPTFYLWQQDTAVLADDNTGTAIADRTAGAVSLDIGSLGAANYWDGQFQLVGMWPQELNRSQVRSLTFGQFAWRNFHSQRTGFVVDLAHSNRTPRELFTPTMALSTGSDPGLSGLPSATVARSLFA